MYTRALAIVAAVILVIVLGVAVLYADRNLSPAQTVTGPTAAPTVSAAPSTTSTAVGTTTGSAPVFIVVRCGTLTSRAILLGQGDRTTFELPSRIDVSTVAFSWPGSGQPQLGGYTCVRLSPGAPTGVFVSLVNPGDTDYVAPTYAIACGRITEFVGFTASADGSLVLTSPGRTPLQVTLTLTHSTPGGSMGGYMCMGLDAGSPHSIFGGAEAGSTVIPEGRYPATRAMPPPTGFVIPQACVYVAPPLVGGDQSEWKLDCGADANRNARGTLAPALTQQGWVACSVGLGGAAWAKGTARVYVGESTLAPGEYPKIVQPARPAASGACP